MKTKSIAMLSLVLLAVFARAQTAEVPPAVRQLGQETAQALATNLLARLTEKVGQGDFAGALEACTKLAPEIAAGVLADRPEVLAVRRITTKPRNEKNRATGGDATMLTAFASGTEPLEPRWRIEPDRYVLYRPLQIQPLCLQCHGPADQLAPQVREKLATLYPKDQATGYTNGAFRGAIKVSLRR